MPETIEILKPPERNISLYRDSNTVVISPSGDFGIQSGNLVISLELESNNQEISILQDQNNIIISRDKFDIGISCGGGEDANMDYTDILGESIVGFIHPLLIQADDGKLYLCDPTNEDHFDRVVGFALGVGIANDPVVYRASGEIHNSEWDWAYGQPVIANYSGGLRQGLTPSDFKWRQVVGRLIDTQTIFVDIEQPIRTKE